MLALELAQWYDLGMIVSRGQAWSTTDREELATLAAAGRQDPPLRRRRRG